MGPAAVAVLLWLQSAPADLLRTAAHHIEQRRYEEAIRDLTRAVALNPRSAPSHLMLGQAYLAKGAAEFVAQAKTEFQQARELDESLVLASFYIARIDLDLGRVRQAEAELRRAIAKKPGEHYLLALLGEARRQQGDTQAAIELTGQALASGDEALPALYYRALAWRDRKDDARALDDLKRLMAKPPVSIDTLSLAGVIHLDARRPGEAESHFRKAIALDPARAEPHLRLAQVLRRQRRFDEARKELALAEAAPQLSSPYFQKLLGEAACEQGFIHLDQGNESRARIWFAQAVQVDPSREPCAYGAK